MSGIYRHILVPIDFTQKNEAAIKVAQELASREESRLTLAHVVEEIDDTTGEEFTQFYDMLLSKATARLATLSRGLRDTGLEVDEYLVVGKPLVEIVHYVQEQNVDLVVLGSHKIDIREGRGNWGTLSYQLSVVCPCQALLVK